MGLEWYDRCTSRRWPKELEPAADLIGVGVVLCNLNTACNNIAQIPEKHTLNTTTFAQDFGRWPGRLGSSCHRHLIKNRKKIVLRGRALLSDNTGKDITSRQNLVHLPAKRMTSSSSPSRFTPNH